MEQSVRAQSDHVMISRSNCYSCADGCRPGTFDEVKLGVRLGEMVGLGLHSKLGPEDESTLGAINGTSLLPLCHSLGYKLGYSTGLLLGV